MLPRIKRFQQLLTHSRLDAYLVTAEKDVSYLLQFPSADSWLLVSSRQFFYVTDARYTQEVKQQFPDVKIFEHQGAIVKGVASLMRRSHIRKLGFDSRTLSLAQFKEMKQARPTGTQLISCDRVVEAMRQIKDAEEISRIQACLAVNLAAYDYIEPLLQPGMSERVVLKLLEDFVAKRGVKFAFPPIVASGPNSAFPHARVMERNLSKNEVVLIDLGIEQDGYKSDLTRIFFLGKIPPLLKKRYIFLKEAQAAAIAAVRPGVAAAAVDAVARNQLNKNKLASYFTHSLGHGVGLDVHEAPRISKTSSAVLKEGMVFTVEPGIYFPGQYGLRVEDMVVVTGNGCEVLSRSARENFCTR